MTSKKLNLVYHKDELMSFWRQNKEAYDPREPEEAREIAFFHRRAQEGSRPLNRHLCEYFISKLLRHVHLVTFVADEILFHSCSPR
jgi:hypothetical protein